MFPSLSSYTDHCQKDSGSESAPSPVHRAATAPSLHLRRAWLSNLSKTRASSSRQPLPRRRVVSSETIHEEGGPFTLAQVEAAESFTTPKPHDQLTLSELPEALVVEVLPPYRDTSIQTAVADQHQTTQTPPDCTAQATQTVFSYRDASVQAAAERRDQSTQFLADNKNQGTQVAPDLSDQSTQCAVEYKTQGAQVVPDCRDKLTQFIVDNRSQEAQVTPDCRDQGIQATSTSAYENHTVQTKTAASEPSEEKGKRAFHDQTSQTDCRASLVRKPPVQSEIELPGRYIEGIEFEDEQRQPLKTHHSTTQVQTESRSFSELTFFTARHCSQLTGLRQSSLSLLDIPRSPNEIFLSIPEDIPFRMLRRPRGDKIILDPVAHSDAASSEAVAQGIVYTPGFEREEELASNTVEQRSPSTSCSSCSSESSCSSTERRSSPPPKVIASQASGTAEGSHYIDAKQNLSSQSLGRAEDSVSQRKVTPDSEAPPISPTTSLPELRNASDSSAQAAHRTRSNGKRRASSVSYWFESEGEDPKGASAQSLTRPQTLAQFRSVPLIRLQRPSTDSERMFGLGNRAVKPIKSVDPVVSVAPAPLAPVEHIAFPDVSLPVPPAGGKKHLRDRLKDRRGKQFLPTDTPAGGKLGMRARVKRKGSKVGRKGRKLVFRRKVLRILLGKELAETVHQTLQAKGNAAGVATGAAEPVRGMTPSAVSIATHAADPVNNVTSMVVAPLPTSALPISSIPVSPTQVDGASSGKVNASSLDSSTDMSTDAIPTGPAEVDGSHEGRKAKPQDKKEQKRQEKEDKRVDEYNDWKTDIEALLSNPCSKCEGHKPDILKVVFETKKKIFKYENLGSSRRERETAAKAFIEKLQCKCPKANKP